MIAILQDKKGFQKAIFVSRRTERIIVPAFPALHYSEFPEIKDVPDGRDMVLPQIEFWFKRNLDEGVDLYEER
jgi:hypothetical protein